MISKPEKLLLQSLSSLGAALYVYGSFAGLVESDSHARDILSQLIAMAIAFLVFVYLIWRGVIKRRIHAWSMFLALAILVYFIN